MKRNRLFLLLLLLLFFVLAGVAAYKAWPLLFPEVSFRAALNPDCNLRQGPCRTALPDGGSVAFSIRPRQIPVVKPLSLEVTITGIEVLSVEVDFTGVDMNMGFNRPKLQRLDAGGFAGEGILPVCVRQAMEWEAQVMIHTADGLYVAPYRFITVKPGVALERGTSE